MPRNFTLGKHFIFEASHQLPNSPCYGKCSNLHGHRYELEVAICGPINSDGWVCNFTEIKEIVKTNIIDKLDHSHLNNFFEIPTAEYIADWIYQTLETLFRQKPYKLKKIKLYETENSYVEIQATA